MNHDQTATERRLELLVEQTLQGLDPAGAAEVAHISSATDDPDLALGLELAAAAVTLAQLGPIDQHGLPPDLAARVERQAIRQLRLEPEPPRAEPSAARRAAGRVGPWLGWLAAAASLALAVYDRANLAPRRLVKNPPPVMARDPLGSSPTARLVATAHPLARGAGGAVVWDEGRQEGALRLEGLAPVDPRSGCYQLWIFDASRDERYPVDGGMFTVSQAAGDQVIPVRPRVPVRRPTLFAVTLEPPGGVVVSDRERLLLTAPWPSEFSAAPPRR